MDEPGRAAGAGTNGIILMAKIKKTEPGGGLGKAGDAKALKEGIHVRQVEVTVKYETGGHMMIATRSLKTVEEVGSFLTKLFDNP